MHWFYDSLTLKSLLALDNLIQDVLLSSDFKREDLVGFRAACKAKHLNQSHLSQSHFSANDGWIKSSVKICLPAEGVKHASEGLAPKFEVPGLVVISKKEHSLPCLTGFLPCRCLTTSIVSTFKVIKGINFYKTY